MNEAIVRSSFSSQPNRIQLTQLGCTLSQPCPHTHSIPLFCIIWLPVLQGKAGLIEVISIIVWVDGTGNKGAFCVYVCACQPGSY